MADEPKPATPPAGEPGQPPAGNPPAEPPKEPGQEPKTFDEAYVKQLRQEAAGYRTKLAESEKKLKDKEDAELSESERAKKQAADAKTEVEKLQSQLREKTVRAEVATIAGKLKIVDADAAHRLLDQAAIQFDDKGEPKNVEALLTQLIKDKPFLVALSGVTTPPNNPGRTGTTLTKEQLSKMTPAEIMRLDQKEVDAVLAG